MVLRNDTSARLNDPSGSIFILEMSECEIVSFGRNIVDRDSDPLGDFRKREEDKCLIQYDDPREVMPMLSSKLPVLNKISSPKPKL